MILVILLLILIILAILYRQTSYYKLASKIPCVKGLPLLGHALDFWAEKDDLLNKMIDIVSDEEYKKILETQGILSLWIGPVAIILVDFLQDIEQIMVTQTKKAFQYTFFEPWLGKGLFTSSGPHWYNHRKLITPAFHFNILEKFIPLFNSNIKVFLKKLDEKVGKGSFDIENYVGNIALDIIAETALSTKINAQVEESEYGKIVKDITEIILLRILRVLFYPDFVFNRSELGKRLYSNRKYIHDFTTNIVKRKKQERKLNVSQENSVTNVYERKNKMALMDLLLEAQTKNQTISDKDILDEVNTTMFAGHDTITSAITFTLYMLSRHQQVQEEVVKEVSDIVGDDDFTMVNLQELRYLERVIKETLRLLPVAPFIARTVDKDTKLKKSGFVVPTGSTILIFIYRMHRNPELFPEPEKFDPDRFLPDESSKRHPYSYLPFSAGPRNCLGQKFAMLEMKAIIAATVRRFKLLPSEDIKPVLHLVLRSANGVNLILERRTNQRQL